MSSYQLRKSDGTLLIDLQSGAVDTTKTSLTLVGKNVSDFGKSQNENFLHLLENFAGVATPSNSIKGQLWFNNTIDQLMVKTSAGFKAIGPFPTPSSPAVSNNSTSTYATTAFVHSILPKGSVIMWYGIVSSIPSGWALCNGQTISGVATPDLRSRFVVGAGSGYNVGDTGGAPNLTQVPAHTHAFTGTTGNNNVDHSHSGVTNSAGNHYHGMPGDDQLSFANNVAGWTANSLGGFSYDARSSSGGGGQVWQTTSAGNHNHTFTTGNQSTAHSHSLDGETASSGLASVSILNPYYALCFIMKIV